MKPFIPVALALCTAALYLLFLPPHLVSWDAIQFALGLEHFAMPFHQPHPPGYLGHMAVGWLFADLGLTTDKAMQAASLAAAALTAPALFFLGRRMYGTAEGLAAALIFALHPLTWYYALSGESYPAEALAATLLVLAGLEVGKGCSTPRTVGFFLVYGLVGGIRQSLPLFFLPFAVWRLFSACSGLSSTSALLRAAIAGIAACAGIVAWGAPLVSLAGGLLPLLDQFQNQFFSMFGAYYSPLLGAGEGAVLTNLNSLWRFGLDALSAGGMVAIVLGAAGRMKAVRGDGYKGVYLAWLLPPLAWFALMFIYKAGHMLVLVPMVALFAARVVIRAVPVERRLIPALLVSGVVAAQAALFLAPPTWWTLTVGDRSWPSVLYAETHTSSTIDAIRHLSAGDPSSVLVVTRDGRFEFRRAMYYLPEFRVLWLMDVGSTGVPRPGIEVCEAHEHEVKCASAPGFWMADSLPDTATVELGPKVRHIAWFAAENGAFSRALARAMPLRRIRAGPIATFPVTELHPGPLSFTIGGYVFRR